MPAGAAPGGAGLPAHHAPAELSQNYDCGQGGQDQNPAGAGGACPGAGSGASQGALYSIPDTVITTVAL
jgi:hypothetical protein